MMMMMMMMVMMMMRMMMMMMWCKRSHRSLCCACRYTTWSEQWCKKLPFLSRFQHIRRWPPTSAGKSRCLPVLLPFFGALIPITSDSKCSNSLFCQACAQGKSWCSLPRHGDWLGATEILEAVGLHVNSSHVVLCWSKFLEDFSRLPQGWGPKDGLLWMRWLYVTVMHSCATDMKPPQNKCFRYPLHTWTSIAFTSHFLGPKSDKSRYCKICNASWAAFYERDGVGLVVALPCSCPKLTQAGAQHALEVLAFTFLIVFSTCSGSVDGIHSMRSVP